MRDLKAVGRLLRKGVSVLTSCPAAPQGAAKMALLRRAASDADICHGSSSTAIYSPMSATPAVPDAGQVP
jgi:hypothetical protein